MPDYKKTLSLPKTSFPMQAGLTKREPETLAFWARTRAYEAMVAANEGAPRFVLHDGPPYANGHIHLGTAMNKVLKDIVVKRRNLTGFKAEYVPGWDCHGLPIEHKVAQELAAKGKTGLPAPTVRRICRSYASRWLDTQREEFKRLGVFGTWDRPYMTMDPAYEAATARELTRFMAQGSVTRSKKPIHWCMDCCTALAEAEVEYAGHASPSIYVRFPLPDPALAAKVPSADPARTFVVIWTTTPWTLPANLAVAAHPDFDYVAVAVDGETYILAEALLADNARRFGWTDPEIKARFRGAELEGLRARHPFYDRDSLIVLGTHVTLEAGTGLVHTAPGHGREDYETGLAYGLEILSPVDDTGRFLPAVALFGGLTVFEANPRVIQVLGEKGHLLAEEKTTHSYPHCWRCKEPVIFRATTQWFISMEHGGLRSRALKAINEDVAWIPSWGRERIHGMIENRPDWCISRQRIWGVPIVALLCADCGEAWFDSDWAAGVVEKFAAHPTGCDWWFETPVEDIAPRRLACPHCGGSRWVKEDDILDVWFDSGTSFAAVVEQRPECRFPADMYLEGSDQHRGWFHSSLLAAVGTRGAAPYKTVLTHGYVVDGEGRKMSKSVGNVVAPQEIIDRFGADILRMWVAAENTQEDVRISEEILSRTVDAYRRIRNTIRFLLGNLGDFDPAAHAVAPERMLPQDRYGLALVARVRERVARAYDRCDFHRAFHALHGVCVNELSAFYLDMAKDRLYSAAAGSPERRSAQTVLWQTLMSLLHDLAPIVSFTAEEAFQHLPPALKPEAETIFATRFDLDQSYLPEKEELERWDTIAAVRAEVTRAIEPLRQAGELGTSLEAAVALYASEELLDDLTRGEPNLAEVFIVSQARVLPFEEAPGTAVQAREVENLRIGISRAPGGKCQRCWTFSETLTADGPNPGVCPRCAAVLGS
jgi:isoleucyl-tRNA synthetase